MNKLKAALLAGTALVTVEIVTEGGLDFPGWGAGSKGTRLKLDIETATREEKLGRVRIIKETTPRVKPAESDKENT